MNNFKISSLVNIALVLFLAGLGLALIIFVNFQLIGSWFGKDGPANLGSIEVSYVSMGRFLRDFNGATWAPFWYLGFPSHVFYTPLLPFLEFLLNKILSIPLWEGYRLLTGLAFILAPVSVFFLGWQLTRNLAGGLLAGMFYSVGPTIFYFLTRGEVWADRISTNFYDPRRFTILVRWGEGPHLFSLIFVPLVGLFFVRFLEKGKFFNLLLCAVFLGLTALSNAIGFFAALMLIFAISFVKFSQTQNFQVIRWTVVTGLVTLGLISFWYNLSFIKTFFREGGSSGNILLSTFPWGWVIGLLSLGLLYLVFARIIKDFALGSVLFWFLMFLTVVGVYYLSASPGESERRIQLLPQALRYNAEVDLSMSLLLGACLAWLVRFWEKITIWKISSYVVGFLVAFFLVWYIQPYVPTAQKAGAGVVDLSKTAEMEVASWLKEHVDETKGERAFVPGNYGFYLNYFSDVWQLRGGLFQASTNFWPDHIYYQLASGYDPQIARAWLVAANIKYVLITTPGSRELYNDIKKPERFAEFEPLYQEKGDVIYQVPLVKPSLAKVVSIQGLRGLEPPKKGDDKVNLLRYTQWLENSSPRELDLKVIDHDHYLIIGEVAEGEGVLVQMTADAGWSASQNRDGVTKGSDPLGFLMLYPKAGKVNIELSHHQAPDVWLGYLISLGTIAALLWYGIWGRQRLIVQ